MSKLTGILIFCVVLMFAGCAKPKGFKFLGFQNPKVNSWGLKESVVGFEVRLFNPNNYQLQIKNASVDVFLNGELLGHSDLDSLIKVPKNDSFAIPLQMTVQTSRAVGGLISRANDTAFVVKLEGNARVGKGGLFFNYPIKYEGKPKIAELIK